jgi:hypothetical protein
MDEKANAKVTFKVTTYWKRPPGEAGLTQVSSGRVSLEEALDRILTELPAGAVTTSAGENSIEIFTDWSKVPDEIRDGTR